MNLFKLKNIVFFSLIILGINSGICQSSNSHNKYDQSHIINENQEDKSEFEVKENEAISENSISLKNQSFFQNKKDLNKDKNINPRNFRTTKIGSLFTKIGLGLNTYRQDNNISGKKALRILKLFN